MIGWLMAGEIATDRPGELIPKQRKQSDGCGHDTRKEERKWLAGGRRKYLDLKVRWMSAVVQLAHTARWRNVMRSQREY